MSLKTNKMEIFSLTCCYRLSRHLPFAAYLISAVGDGIISMHKSLSDIDRREWRKKKPPTTLKNQRHWLMGQSVRSGAAKELCFPAASFWGSVGDFDVCVCVCWCVCSRDDAQGTSGLLSILNCSIAPNPKNRFASSSEASWLRILIVPQDTPIQHQH